MTGIALPIQMLQLGLITLQIASQKQQFMGLHLISQRHLLIFFADFVMVLYPHTRTLQQRLIYQYYSKAYHPTKSQQFPTVGSWMYMYNECQLQDNSIFFPQHWAISYSHPQCLKKYIINLNNSTILFSFISRNISSTESDVNICIGKA